jgi:ribosomal subunit interface protein
MKINISNRHDSATGNIKQYIEAGLATLSEKYDILGADVILDQEGHIGRQFSADITLHVKGSVLHTKEVSEEPGTSVDLAIKTLEKRLKKFKETHYSSFEPRRNAISK